MSTNGMIAWREPNVEVVRGHYVHWDGDSVGDEVKKIIERDGVEKAIQTLIHDHPGWSSINADASGRLGRDTGRFTAVEGYGDAYTTAEEDGDFLLMSADGRMIKGGQFIQYVHIIEPDGQVTTVQPS